MILIIGVVVLGYTFYNLKSNSVYYAKNMPKGEGQHPELVMLIDNLDWIYQPEIKDIQYLSDGTRTISRISTEERFTNIYDETTEYKYKSTNGVSFIFTKRMELVYVKDHKSIEDINDKKVYKKKGLDGIISLVQPIIDKQTKPSINLQWLFNIIYQEEFK